MTSTPAWAQRAGLPCHDDMKYLHELGVTLIGATFVLYLVHTVATRPGRLGKIVKSKFGG